MQMQGMLDLQIDTPEGAARILSDGQIVLLQQKSALIDSITRTLYNKDPLADLNFEQYSVYDIVDKYNARNGKSNLLLFILIYSICRESLLRGKDHSAATRKQLFNNDRDECGRTAVTGGQVQARSPRDSEVRLGAIRDGAGASAVGNECGTLLPVQVQSTRRPPCQRPQAKEEDHVRRNPQKNEKIKMYV